MNTLAEVPRDTDQLESLLEGPREIELLDGLTITLRPFTFGSVALAKKLGLDMFSGKEDKDKEEEHEEISKELSALEDEIEEEEDLSDEVMQELATFFWMQSQPVKEVLGHVRSGTWKNEAEEFAHYIPLHKMAELLKETNRISEMAASAAVDIAPKGDSTGDEDAPKN